MKNAYQERLRQQLEEDVSAYIDEERGAITLIDELVEILDDWHDYYQGKADDIKQALLRMGENRYD